MKRSEHVLAILAIVVLLAIMAHSLIPHDHGSGKRPLPDKFYEEVTAGKRGALEGVLLARVSTAVSVCTWDGLSMTAPPTKGRGRELNHDKR